MRDDVNGVLEAARGAKRIGKPLEAAVVLRAKDESAKEALKAVESMNLAELFIVSKCLIADDEAADEHVSTKCPRCWMHSVDADPETGLCPRCKAVVAKL